MIPGLNISLVDFQTEDEMLGYGFTTIFEKKNGIKCVSDYRGDGLFYIVFIPSLEMHRKSLEISCDGSACMDPDGGFTWITGKIEQLVDSLTSKKNIF